MIYTVSLKGLKFVARHGVYEFEKKNGNNFIVNVEAKISDENKEISNPEKIIDYEIISSICKEEMENTKDYLEEVATEIAKKIHEKISFLHSLSVEIEKLNPPINIACKGSSVKLEWEFCS